MGVGAGERGGQGVGLVAVLAQHRNEQRALVLRQAGLAHTGQHTVRTQLEEGGHALTGQETHPVRETHRLTHMPHPVPGVVRRHQLTGDVRHHRRAGLVVVQLGRDLTELGQHRLHQRRVERMRHRQPARTVA